MTLDDLKLYVWRRVGVRRVLCGRKVVEDFVELTVQSWEPRLLHACVNEEQRSAVCANILRSVKRGYQVVSGRDVNDYGIFWVVVLQAVATLVVQIILRWWDETRMNRVRMEVWRTELTR